MSQEMRYVVMIECWLQEKQLLSQGAYSQATNKDRSIIYKFTYYVQVERVVL